MEPFKNMYSKESVGKLAEAIQFANPKFSKKNFLEGLERDFKPLELKQRMLWIVNRLEKELPSSPEKSFPVLVRSLSSHSKNPHGVEGFLVWPLTVYVSKQGAQNFELTMKTLCEMTKVFTSEFAIRKYFLEQEERTLRYFQTLVKHENEHVRRWVSEGSRPLLPWGEKIPKFQENPEKTWGLLEILKDDESLYVRKSVANHINDLSKAHPRFVTKKLNAWKKGAPKERLWVIKHALRTLIKKGDSDALKILGVKKVQIKLSQVKALESEIKIGDRYSVECVVKNLEKKKVKVVVDQEIGFLKKNGSLSKKVFKGSVFELESLASKKLQLSVSFKKVTTRVYYPGMHTYELKINGKHMKLLRFNLK